MPIAHHQPVTVAVDLIDQGLHVGVGLGLEGGGQHAPGSLPADLVQPQRQLRAGTIICNYSQHRRSFLTGVGPPALLFGQRERYAAPSIRWCIHCDDEIYEVAVGA
jgi:hypothetical protein